MVSRLVSCTCPAQCMVCMVSGVLFPGWDNGTLGNTLSEQVTQDPRVRASEIVSRGQTLRETTSEASSIHPTHTNVCVCECRHILCPYIRKAYFPSSLCSVVSWVRLSCGGSESLACETTCLAQLFCLHCTMVWLFCHKTYLLFSPDPILALASMD